MSHSCGLHTTPASLTMEKSVQCDNMEEDVGNLTDTEEENQEEQDNVTGDTMTNAHTPFPTTTNSHTPFPTTTNGHAPFPATSQTDESITAKELQPQPQPQPLVKALTEDKHAFLKNIFGKSVKDDMNLEIIDFHSMKENRLNFSLNPNLSKPASLVTVIKFQRGEFVEVKSLSSYNSSMCLRDMKNAISAALDSCISQPNLEAVPSPPRSCPRNDVSANDTTENNSQGKSVIPKRTPPKAQRDNEGNTGTGENITSTSEDIKGKPGSPKGNTGPKGTNTGIKGTHTRPKGRPEGPTIAEKPKKTPEKVKDKTEEVSKEKPQPTKEKVEAPPEPNAAKPEQTRVKKPKIPDEESIKFANRQREIQKMKKELKERLKREGKEGVDPVARMNAWGRTVGVTCTMCGHHVQKSYGCFRRDTAPQRLRHLFTPGMNRIKICRRCLPYKKLGKAEQILKPGLLSLPSDPRGLNPGTNTPVTIAPVPDKPVSASTLNAIHRKVTGQETTGRENTAHVNIIASLGHVNIGAGHVNASLGHVNNSSGQMNNSSDHVKTGSVHVNTGSVHVNTESGHVIDNTASCLPPEIDLSGESSKGSAIEYIKKLALNLRTNYTGQQGESSMAAKNELITPEEQIIKTPIFEHLSNFTPVTPSMNLGNQVTNTASIDAPGANLQPSQWKPVLNQVTPVNKPVTLETAASFVQETESNVIPTPPWTTVPIVLKTQPNIVLTSSNQVPRDPKSAPLQTFVTAANQKDLKLLPTIMVPSQNALPRQGPVLLQIQRVKLVREKIGERVEIKDKTREEQGKQNEMIDQPGAGLGVTDYGGYTRNVGGSTGNHQQLPEEISSAEVENSISNFLSQAKEISPAQVEPSNGNFQTLTDEISSTQLETSTGNIQKITEELAFLIGGTSGYTQDNDVNMMDTIGHFSTEQDNVSVTELVAQVQSEKTSEDLNTVDSKILESGFLQPTESLGEQIIPSGSLGMSYSQDEPAVLLCGSADISSQDTTMYPSGYQVVDEKDSGQGGVIGGSSLSQSCVRNIFQSQISEEYLPQVDDGKLNEINKLETVKELIDEVLLPEGGHFEKEELLDVLDVKSGSSETHISENTKSVVAEKEIQDIGNEGKNLETTEEGFSVEMKEEDGGGKVEDEKEYVQEEKKSPRKGEDDNKREKSKKDETDLNISTNPEKQAKVKETINKEVPEVESISTTLEIDENVTLDLRRSQRRTASPRKPSPSKSPVKKIEPRVHGTRQSALRQQGSQKGKAVQQGSQKDKSGQQATQRGKTERQGSQKDEKEHEATQGVKRKRQGRGTKPAKVTKT